MMNKPMSPLLETVLDWIETPDWGASAAYLKEHPELLSDHAAQVLAQLLAAAQAAHNGMMAREFTRHYVLAALVRREGITEAYSRIIGAGSSAE
jgi:hypothetical protein